MLNWAAADAIEQNRIQSTTMTRRMVFPFA
jgi:hypothetical protein